MYQTLEVPDSAIGGEEIIMPLDVQPSPTVEFRHEAVGMIFDRIASGLTKHYKMVLVIWIVALLISVPAILQVNSVINYQHRFQILVQWH